MPTDSIAGNFHEMSKTCFPGKKNYSKMSYAEMKTQSANVKYIAITKTCLYNVYPLKPNFYIVKLGFAGVYIIFLISAENIDCGYSLEPPRSVFSRNVKKNTRIFI